MSCRVDSRTSEPPADHAPRDHREPGHDRGRPEDRLLALPEALDLVRVVGPDGLPDEGRELEEHHADPADGGGRGGRASRGSWPFGGPIAPAGRRSPPRGSSPSPWTRGLRPCQYFLSTGWRCVIVTG